uniref:Testis expressed 264, ER-phagy receptor n=1 Tax=Cynoglossus semilaevis TaxID=244447 RepID=A0A3P8UEV6_CYNSE
MIMSEWLCLCVATITSLLLVAAYICLYSGLLSAITVVAGSPPIKKILFAYKYNEGPYRDCEKISRESLSIGPKLPCIYVFYDDPQKVTGPLCRCAVGSVLSEGETPADQELLKRYETSGFGVFSFPEVTHVVTAATSLPHTTFFSLLLRVKRVYPRLQHYIKVVKHCSTTCEESWLHTLTHCGGFCLMTAGIILLMFSHFISLI